MCEHGGRTLTVHSQSISCSCFETFDLRLLADLWNQLQPVSRCAGTGPSPLSQLDIDTQRAEPFSGIKPGACKGCSSKDPPHWIATLKPFTYWRHALEPLKFEDVRLLPSVTLGTKISSRAKFDFFLQFVGHQSIDIPHGPPRRCASEHPPLECKCGIERHSFRRSRNAPSKPILPHVHEINDTWGIYQYSTPRTKWKFPLLV